jgi:hypothetical protein
MNNTCMYINNMHACAVDLQLKLPTMFEHSDSLSQLLVGVIALHSSAETNKLL